MASHHSRLFTTGSLSLFFSLSLSRSSALALGADSWAPDPLGDESLPKQCWPDPKAMVDQLKDAGVELMISPYFHQVAEQSKYYEGTWPYSHRVDASRVSGHCPAIPTQAVDRDPACHCGAE